MEEQDLSILAQSFPTNPSSGIATDAAAQADLDLLKLGTPEAAPAVELPEITFRTPEEQEDFKLEQQREANRTNFQKTRDDIVNQWTEPGAFSSGPIRFAHVAGGLAAGSAEWGFNIAGTTSYAIENKIRNPEIPFSTLFQEAPEATREAWNKIFDNLSPEMQEFFGRSSDPKVQAALQDLGETINTFVGTPAKLFATGVDMLIDEVKGKTVEEVTNFLEGAKPWAHFMAQTAVEIAAFKGAHSAGKFIKNAVKSGLKPPPTPAEVAAAREGLFDEADIVASFERANNPAVAAQKLQDAIREAARDEAPKDPTNYYSRANSPTGRSLEDLGGQTFRASGRPASPVEELEILKESFPEEAASSRGKVSTPQDIVDLAGTIKPEGPKVSVSYASGTPRGSTTPNRARASQTLGDIGGGLTYMHSGIPIDPKIATQFLDAAKKKGMAALEYLKLQGYDKKAIDTLLPKIEEATGKDKNQLVTPPSPLKDTAINRGKVRKNIEEIGNSVGLLSTKTTKEGRPFGEFTLEEVQNTAAELGYGNEKLSVITKKMREAGLLKSTTHTNTDLGFADYVQKTLGKAWDGELTMEELQLVRNRLLNTMGVVGRYPVVQSKGMRPITEYHMMMLKRMADSFKRRSAETKLGQLYEATSVALEGTIWWMKKLEQAVPGSMDILLWPLQAAEKRAVINLMTDRANFRGKIKELQLKRSDLKEVGRYAIAQQEAGRKYYEETRQSFPEKLTPKQQQLYDYIRDNIYEPMWMRLNQARFQAGLDPISYVPDYFTFMRYVDKAIENGQNLITRDASLIDQEIKDFQPHPKQTHFGSLKKRVGSKLAIKDDAKYVVERYLANGHKYIEMTPEIAYLRKMFDTVYKKEDIVKEFGKDAWPADLAGHESLNMRAGKTGGNGLLYDTVSDWLNYIAGTRTNKKFKAINAFAAGLNRNLAFSILAYNVGSMMRQTGAWRHAWNSTSTYDMLLGAAKTMSEFKTAPPGTKIGEARWTRGARGKSDVLVTRTFDATVDHILDVLEGKRAAGTYLSYLQEKVGKAGLQPLRWVDEVVAVVAWNAAESFGKRKLGLKGEALRKYADQVVIETQGSGTKLYVPDILRTPIGRSLFMFQTYVLNEWSYLTRNVLGYDSARPTKGKVQTVLRYMAITTAMSLMFESLGIRSPFPTPIDAYRDAVNRGDDQVTSAFAAMKELLETVPGVGGAIRYNTGLGGPGASTLESLFGALNGDPFTPPAIVSALKLVGMPGTTGVYNGIRVLSRQLDESVAGQRRTWSSRSRSSRARSSRTRSSNMR